MRISTKRGATNTVSSSHSLFGRYTGDFADKAAPNPEFAFYASLITRNQYVTIGHTSVLSPQMVNSFRTGLNRLDGRKFFPLGTPRRNPNVGGTRRHEWDANIAYNVLLMGFGQQLANGLQFTTSYTFSKVMNESDHGNGGALSGASNLLDPDDVRRNRGPGDIDQKHVVT